MTRPNEIGKRNGKCEMGFPISFRLPLNRAETKWKWGKWETTFPFRVYGSTKPKQRNREIPLYYVQAPEHGAPRTYASRQC